MQKSWLKFVVVVALLFLVPSVVLAEIDLKMYNEIKKNRDPVAADRLSDYVVGVGKGIFWSNVMLRYKKEPKLYCAPGDFVITGDVIESLLTVEISLPSVGKSYTDDTPIEYIVLRAIMAKFPCK